MTTTDAGIGNIELVRKGFEAFSAGDMAALGELFDSNASWRNARQAFWEATIVEEIRSSRCSGNFTKKRRERSARRRGQWLLRAIRYSCRRRSGRT